MVDVRAMTLVDIVDLSRVELVFNTRFGQVWPRFPPPPFWFLTLFLLVSFLSFRTTKPLDELWQSQRAFEGLRAQLGRHWRQRVPAGHEIGAPGQPHDVRNEEAEREE